MKNKCEKAPWGTPMFRNKLLFATIARANHRHPMIHCPNIDDQYVARRGDDGLTDCEEIIYESEREKAAGCGYPRCGCPTPQGRHWAGNAPGCCWPQIIVQNGMSEEYVVMRVTPQHYAGLNERTDGRNNRRERG